MVVQPNHRHQGHSSSGRRTGNSNYNSGHITTTGAVGNDNSNDEQSAAPKIQDNINYGTASASASASNPAPAQAGSSSYAADNAGEGGSDGPPPSYAQVVAGDNKIQSHD